MPAARPSANDTQESSAGLEQEKSLLRFITCGSVDDGKSTLLGRLLYDCQLLFDDQLSGLRSESARYKRAGGEELDFSLLVDGLEAEREQGITIDVAYRYFSTANRTFIVAMPKIFLPPDFAVTITTPERVSGSSDLILPPNSMSQPSFADTIAGADSRTA